MTSTAGWRRRAATTRFSNLLVGGLLVGGLLAGGVLAAGSFAAPAPARAQEAGTMTVYRSPSCGCCGAWVDYIEGHGIPVEVREVDDTVPVKMLAGVPEALYACHTAAIDGYTVEGHVPIEAIRRLLEERPDVQGIGVAGMPAGSPGMGGPVTQPYTAYTFGDGEVGAPFMTFPAEQ